MAPNEYMCVIKNGIDLIKTVQTYFPMQTFSIQNSWIAKCLMLLSILVSIFHSTTAFAGTPISLSKSYAGNLSYVLAGASFRNSESNSCTFNSTASGTLDGLPDSATVIAAYVYWAGSYDTPDEPDSDVTFEGSSLHDQNPYTEDFFFNNSTLNFYSGRAEVTSLVQSRRDNTYTMSDLSIETSPHCTSAVVLGGWAMVVIYEDDSEPTRVVNLYEGFQRFRGSSFNITANNFEVSSTPSGKHSHITWEGDVANSGTSGGFSESLTMITSSGSRALTDPVNPTGEQFNSRSNIYGSGSPTYGLDIDMYDIGSYLTPGETSFTTQYSSGGDLVLLTAEITSVSNISVADLAVTTSAPTGWQSNSTVTKKFTISNNGPDDIPTQSARFTTNLPVQLTFNGAQGDSDWLCTQSNQDLSCVFQSKLRSGWSDYLDLTFDVGNVASTTVNMDVIVDHDTAPYDIFDNQTSNNTYSMSVPVATDPVVDLSASSKVPDNLNGDLLLAGDTLQYIITIDDASNLAVSGITVTDVLPSNIAAYRVTQYPAGSSWSVTDSTLTFINISLEAGTGAGSTKEIIIEVDIDPSAPDGASLQNQATITHGADIWLVDTGDITVVEIDFSVSTKDVYDVNGGVLLPNETARYTITVEDLNDSDISGVQVTDNLPNNISSFSVVALPSGATDYSITGGGLNGTGYIDVRGININSTETAEIIIDVVVDTDAPTGASLLNTATVTLNSKTWDVTSNNLTINEDVNTAASGNKPLYLLDNELSRNLPSTDNSVTIDSRATETWAISPSIQDNLTLNAGTIRLDLAIEGNQTNNNRLTTLTISAYYNDNIGGGNQVFASGTFPEARWDNNEFYNESLDLTLDSETTIPSGSSIYLSINNTVDNNNGGNKHDVFIHRFNGTFYSQLVLDAATVVNVDSITVWDSTYGDPTGTGDGSLLANSQPDTNLFIRAVISDPFGAFDISSADINIVKTNGDIYDFSTHPDGNTNIMNQVDDTADDLTTNTKTFEKEITLLEEDESTGYWTITVKGYEGLEVAPDQITHERDLSFWIKPFLPSIALTKSITVTTDPINGTTNPKAIPGAELTYEIKVINSGRGKSDDGSLILQDEIPLNSDLYVGNIICSGTDLGPVCFKEGSTPDESGLSFVYVSLTDASDDLFFSTDGSDFTYEPVDSGDGYDPAIRYIRMIPANELNNAPKDASAQPEFNFYYQIRLN